MPEAWDVILQARASAKARGPIPTRGRVWIAVGVLILAGALVSLALTSRGPMAAFGALGAMPIKYGMSLRPKLAHSDGT